MAINPVGTWTDPNFESGTGTEYKTALDNAARVAKRIVNAFAPHAKTTPDMNVLIDAGAVLNDISVTEVAQQTIGPISAPSTHPRIDRIVIDRLTGTASRIAGTEAASPVAPAIPDEKNPCALIALSVGQTSIVNANITDERILSGAGGAVVKLKSGANQTISGTTETTITAATKALPGGLLGSDNYVDWFIEAENWDLPEDGANTKFRVKLGGTTLCTATYTASSQALDRTLLLWIRVRNDGATNAQRAFIAGFLNSTNPSMGGGMVFGTGSVDTTASRDLTITVEHSHGDAAITIVGQSGVKFS